MITLRHLHAENFKGLRSVDLTFPERGNILIEGHNEAGKSTLFEAVYVALYGQPLVGEKANQPRQDEVIQHGQPQALVELTFAVGVQELTVQRVFKRGARQAQLARLTIRRPDGTEEAVNRAAAVNERILQELNNLDGDNLRNSCFVEQQELGRLEEMDSGKREQAIQKLLGLERLTKLSDQFKFKREQERELDRARSLLQLAHAQADRQAAEAEEQTLAERFDAALVVTHVAEHAALGARHDNIQGRLGACEQRGSAVRNRLARAAQVRAQLATCGEAQRQLEKAAALSETAGRLSRQLADLRSIEQETKPKIEARLAAIGAALALVTDAEHLREATRAAAVAVQEAQHAVEELEYAEEAVRQRTEGWDAARMRAEQRRRDIESARDLNQRRVTDLAARYARLNLVLEYVTTWERAREHLEATQREIRAAEDKVRARADLQGTMQQREEAARRAAEAAVDAEGKRLEAETRRRQAEGCAALREWIRLKQVEASLAGYADERGKLDDRQRTATQAYAAAQRRARRPLYGALAATLLAVFAFAAGALWIWALALGGIFAATALLFWVSYARTRAAVRSSAAAVQAVQGRSRDLAVQYDAAVRAGGNPALLAQRERELAAARFVVPESLDAARTLLARFPDADGTYEYQSIRAGADEAVAQAARMTAASEGAQQDVEQTRAALRVAEAEGDPETLLRDLNRRETERSAGVEVAEAAARKAAGADSPWPASRGQVQAALAACQAERQTVERASAELDISAASGEHDDANAIEQAKQTLQTAEDAAAVLRAPDPQAELAAAREILTRADTSARKAESKTRLAAHGLGLAPNHAEVEAERGRAEEQLHALDIQLATRPALAAELSAAQAARVGVLESVSKAFQAIIEAMRPLAADSTLSLPTIRKPALDEHQLAGALLQIRAAIESGLATLDEAGAKGELEAILHEQGILTQSLRATRDQIGSAAEAIRGLLTAHHLPVPEHCTSAEVANIWPLTGTVEAGDKDRVQADLQQTRNRLFAKQDQERRLTEELEHPGTLLSIGICDRRVRELVDEQAICQRALEMIHEARERLARQVLPTTERNMELLLPELTAQRYWGVRLTPPDGEDGQLTQLDYRIRIWDQTAGRYVAKNLFSGGTRDQCSLALRLAFALATLPQELGVAPGFIFLDEPLSAFDAQRAQALVDLLTTGTIAQQFAQVVVISHHHAFDRRAFQYHVRMEDGQAVESDLPESREHVAQHVGGRAPVAVAPRP